VVNREVEILDPIGLRNCTRNTRGLADDGARSGAAPARQRIPQRAAPAARQVEAVA